MVAPPIPRPRPLSHSEAWELVRPLLPLARAALLERASPDEQLDICRAEITWAWRLHDAPPEVTVKLDDWHRELMRRRHENNMPPVTLAVVNNDIAQTFKSTLVSSLIRQSRQHPATVDWTQPFRVVRVKAQYHEPSEENATHAYNLTMDGIDSRRLIRGVRSDSY